MRAGNDMLGLERDLGGGYIYHSDHSVPDNVSLDQYCRVMELVAERGSYG